jgi:hypothetical protein
MSINESNPTDLTKFPNKQIPFNILNALNIYADSIEPVDYPTTIYLKNMFDFNSIKYHNMIIKFFPGSDIGNIELI